MSFSFPKVHIVIAGIEKLFLRLMICSFSGLCWPHSALGQKITAYNSIIFGPKKEGETDGPEEMYVILLDNRRTKVLEQERTRRALSCIRCGAA